MPGLFSGQSLGPGQTYDTAGRIIPIAPNAIYGDPASFTTAANKQQSDYDAIMSKYKQQFDTPTSVAASTANLGDLATTGGYTPQNIADIRARGVSPIRSIYAQANENLSRQRALQGGYSPGFDATTAKMAREEAGTISGAVTNVNAGIAESVARNRLAAASPYASATAGEAERQLRTTEGMRGLYGTTPALTNVFGDQVATAARLGQGQQDINIRRQQGNTALGMRLMT